MSSRQQNTKRNRQKSKIQLVIHLILPIYLLCLIGSQLVSPTGASFNDITTIPGTLSFGFDFREAKETDGSIMEEGLSESDVSKGEFDSNKELDIDERQHITESDSGKALELDAQKLDISE